jgi:COP9 signalosome complex subunit 1
MGNEDLGNYCFAIGSYPNAFRYYSNMREFCTTPRHIAVVTLKLLYVSIAQRNWSVTQSYRLKMNGIGLRDDERTTKFDPLLNACMGLAYLNLSAYRDAAETFLHVDPGYLTPEPQAGIVFQRQVLTPNDIAVYGGLCALATMDRNELQRRVLENQPFRQFLELESHLRRAISMFCSSKYSGCLSILDAYAHDYNIDLYLQDHFSNLYRMVRSKCIVQWFSAFSVVTLDEMVKSFPPQEASTIEDELENMIKSGQLDARIDLVDRVCATWIFSSG